MSQAKTQLVKNYGLTSSASSNAAAVNVSHNEDENTWMPSNGASGLGVAMRPSNTSDSASGWSKSVLSNSTGSGKEQLWSSDSSSSTSSLLMTPNHNHHHMGGGGQEENNYNMHNNSHVNNNSNQMANHHQHNSTSSNQHSQPGNHLKSIQNTSWNHLNNNSSHNGTASMDSQNGGMCMNNNNNSSPNNEQPSSLHQQQQRNQINNSINNSNQNDLINSDTWNLFSSTPIIGGGGGGANSAGVTVNSTVAAAISSSSSSSSTNNLFSGGANPGANSSDSNMHGNAFGSHAAGGGNHPAWSSSIQNGWDSGAGGNNSSSSSGNATNGNFNDWQMSAPTGNQTASNNNSSNNTAANGGGNSNPGSAAMNSSGQNAGSANNASNSNAISSSSSSSSSSKPTGSGASLPTVPPPSIAASTASAAAPSSRSWAKIVSQQSSPSAANLPSSATASSSANANTSSTSSTNPSSHNSNSQHSSAGGVGGSSASTNVAANQAHAQNMSNQYSFNPNQNSQMSLNHSNSQTKNNNSNINDASSSSHDMSSNDINNGGPNDMNNGNNGSVNPLNYEWNIKVNQHVPWSLDGSAESKASFNKNMSMMQAANAMAAANAAVANSAGTTASNLSTTSSSSSSSSIGNEMSGLQKSAMLQQQQAQGQQPKSLADTGTEIWLGANPNKPMPMSTGWGDGPNATSVSTPQSSSSPTSGSAGANNWSPNGSKANVGGSSANMMKWPMHHDQSMLKSDYTAVNSPTEAANSGASSQWGTANAAAKPPSSWAGPSANTSVPAAAGQADQGRGWMQSSDSSSPSLQAQTNSAASAAAGPVTPAIPAYVIKGPIEPSGWDDPDFKTSKKSDDGTNIWGDPESQKQMKVQKWSYCTKHAPNPQTLKAALTQDTEHFQGGTPESPLGQSMPQQMMQNPAGLGLSSSAGGSVMANSAMMMGANPTVSSPTSTTPINSMNAGAPNQGGQSQGGWPTNNGAKMQQAIGQSQWTNTPAAPSAFMNEGSRNSPNFNPSSDWTIGLVDTTSWSTKDAKNNFDPSVGVIDTSKWSSSNPGPGGNSGNGSPGFLSQQPGVLGPMNPGVGGGPKMMNPGAMNGFTGTGNPAGTPGADWPANMFGNRGDDSMDGRHKAGRMMTGNNPLGGNQSLINPGLQRMTSVGNNVSGFNSSLNPGFNTQLSQPNSKNFAPSQSGGPFNSQNLNLNNNMMLNSNNTNNIAMMAGLGNQGNTSNSPLNSSAPTPQIQNQLIESFRLAVQAGLISPDLLNTKLPQDVLTLLYQLFQTLNHYMNSTNKHGNLQKRRTQMNPAQFKQESDNLNQEVLLFKETLIGLQGKINSAHMLLKQQAGGNGGKSVNPIQSSSSSTNIGSVSLAPTPPMGNLTNSNLISNLTGLGNATGADIELFATNPMSKDSAQKPKLLQLLSETPSGSSSGSNKISSNPSISRQASQPAKLNSMNQNNFFNSFGSNTPNSFANNSSQWSDSSPFEQLPALDDRITPFVPGQLWTGQGHSSIEDDPNCTPGSVSKPILTETFDPESILREHRNSQWSNSLTGGNDSFLLGSGLGGSQFNSLLSSGSSKTVRGGSWSSNGGSANSAANGGGNMGGFSSQMSLQNQNQLLSNNGGGNSSSIGEQLWGVKSNNNNNRVGGSTAGGPNSMNRNTSAFNAPNNGNGNGNSNSMLHQQQQNQFYRSNSWNVTPQQQQQPAHQQLSNSQDNRSSNSNNLPLSNGHFVLIKNVQPQIDQSTLRALCAQHASGTLTYYRYIPQMTCAIVRYNSKEEANNAQSKLNTITLSNATLYTQPLNENDLKFLFSM